MKTLITDVIGLTGFGSLAAGVYLQFGLAMSLMMSGNPATHLCAVSGNEGNNAA